MVSLSQIVVWERKQFGEWDLQRVLFLYLAAITVAELITALASPFLGAIAHAALFAGLLAHGAFLVESSGYKPMMCLSLAPLLRILSLALPYAALPLMYWFLIVSIPLFVAIVATARFVGVTRKEVGLTFSMLPTQFLVTFTGIPLGVVEYLILRPSPLVQAFSLQAIAVPALILLVCTGFLEELMFRGLFQGVFCQVMGVFKGLLYVTLLFAVMHIGYLSVVDVVFVFVGGAWFGWVRMKTGSILGVTLSHGLTNIMLYLIAPFIFPR